MNKDNLKLLEKETIHNFNKIFNMKLKKIERIYKKAVNSWYISSDASKLFKIIIIVNGKIIKNKKFDLNIIKQLNFNFYENIFIRIKSCSRNEYNKINKIEKFTIQTKNIYEHYIIENYSKKILFFTICKNKKRVNKSYKINNIKNKKLKKDWSLWISASKIRNYLLSDPLLDWLKEYNITSINDKPQKRKKRNYSFNVSKPIFNINNFTQYIMNKGNIYEDKIINFLKTKTSVVKVAESYQSKINSKFKKTIKLMKKGEIILYQAVLHNENNKTYGSPDLLIRSDKINDIFGYKILDDNERLKPSLKLEIPFHYVVVEIKWSTLQLNSDGRTLRNSESIPAYKGQVLIYNQALGLIQGYEPPEGYILGNKWKYTKKNITYQSSRGMDRLGVIDFKYKDLIYYDKVDCALKWIRDVRKYGHEWRLLPKPSRNELYPNMNNERDGYWKKLKIELSKKIGEITSIWMCGSKERLNAHSQKIYSWCNKECNASILGIKSQIRKNTVNQILKTNNNNIKIYPSKILFDYELNWRKAPVDTIDFYIDYETLNSNFGKCSINNLNEYKDNSFVFLIGVGWEEKNKWQFKSFYAKTETLKSELEMINNFWLFINKKLFELRKKKSRFIHWTQAEPLAYKKMQKRHINLPDKNFMDLYHLFLKNPITIKGALDFKLKSIAKAMKKNNMIKSSWNENNPCSNGLSAMLWAHRLYKKKCILSEEPTFNDIIHYNQIDCKVLWEILSYLRLNH